MKRIFAFLLGLSGTLSSIAQVSPQTGSATFGIPMFNWVDHRSKLNSSVAIQYSSGSGLKVDEIASNVGQGWNLLAGGVISRMKVGEPDDQQAYGSETNSDDLNKYPSGYLYSNSLYDVYRGCPKSLIRYPLFGGKNRLYKQHNSVAEDRELDKFAFQFNGKSGIFVLSKNGNVGEFIGDTKMKVWFERDESMINRGIRTTINTFYIQDDNGLIYQFSDHELTRVLKFNYCDQYLQFSQTQPQEFKEGEVYHEATVVSDDPVRSGEIVHPFVINGWYLTRVTDPLTARFIEFKYEVDPITANGGSAISYYWGKDYIMVSHIRSVTETPRLTDVIFPDGHRILFSYNSTPRIDLPGAHALTSVKIFYNTRILSGFELTNSYFIANRIGTPTVNNEFQRNSARLCLLEVKKISVDQKSYDPPYKFDYFMGSTDPDDIVPPPFSLYKDVWGYYNGHNSKDFNGQEIDLSTPETDILFPVFKGLVYLRNNSGSGIIYNAKLGYAKNGLLKKIKYPTGGSLSYEYEQNKGVINSQNINVGGVHVSKTIVSDGGFSNDCTNALTTNYTYNDAPGSSSSSLWGLEAPRTSITMTSHYAPEDKFFYMRNGITFGCDYHFMYPGILSREQALSLTNGQQLMIVLTKVLDVVSGIMTVIDVVSLCLKFTPAALIAVIIDIIASVVTIVITCSKDMSKDDSNTVYYNSDLNGSNPLPAQFRRVEVTESSGGNGKTVMEFTDQYDYPLWVADNEELTMEQRFAYWAYGLPKKTTVFNANGVIVKQVINEYDTTYARRSFLYHPGVPKSKYASCQCTVKKSYSQKSPDWENPAKYQYLVDEEEDNYADLSTNDLFVKIYEVYSGRTQLISTTERTFKPGSSTDYLETKTSYTYNTDDYLVNSINTTQSNGDQSIKKVYYNAINTYNSGVFNILNSNNIVGVPVREENLILKAGGVLQYLGETATEYVQVSNGDIKPRRKLQQRFSSPQSSISTYSGPYTVVPANYNIIENYTYDADGNLSGVSDEGARVVNNLYDYEDKYIVAFVINSVPDLDKAAYTSFETSKMGGWTLSGERNAIANSGVTGKNSLSLSASNTLSASINTAKPYRLSFWANGSLSINNATLLKSAPVINGFTYYEYSIAQGTAIVSISGTALVDELRLHPQIARMRTTAYDPLIGKTAECDENNRITYYEYDSHDRLQFIKDERGNIIKMYEYNTAKNLPSACNVIFYNKAISEKIVRNNCTVNQQPGNILYTIPAGKYSSTISQATADLEAENELNSLGQFRANDEASCHTIFFNDPLSQSFTRQGCAIGYAGTSIAYNIPQGRYRSIVSQPAANKFAEDDMAANGQAFANNSSATSCVISTEPVWEGTDVTQCQNGHRFVQVKDMNPNSATYNQTQFIDTGYDEACTPQPPAYSVINSTCAGANSTFVVTGHTGDVIQLKLRFAGQLGWNGSTDGTGAVITFSALNEFCAQYSEHYYTSFPSVDLECMVTVVMPSTSITVNTTVNLYNSVSSSGVPTLEIISINGSSYSSNPNYPCYSNTSGFW